MTGDALTEAPSLANRFRHAARSFAAASAPLYAHLAAQAADELQAPSPLRALLEPWQGEPARLLFHLRVLAAVHRWVLAGDLPELARHYPTAGGDLGPEGSWPAFRAAILDRADRLPQELAGLNQHNEVARAAGLSVGLLDVARTGHPLRLLEVGASAGLLLRWDRYRDLAWWPRLFRSAPPSGRVAVSDRRGCDLKPVDATTGAGALRLRGFVWADLVEHMRMLEDAIEIASQVPVRVDQADGADWLEAEADPAPGLATVILHSMMVPASARASLLGMEQVIARKARCATADAPLAYLRFETAGGRELTIHVEVRLTTWPGGEERLVATCDVNGRNVRLQPSIE
jgi:hypothetical protein